MSELVGKNSEDTYLGKPLRTFEGTLRVNDELFVPVNLAIHPNLSRRVLINVPGTRGEIDGYAGKYKILGHHIQSQELAAVVRTGNDFTGLPTDVHLNASLQYVREHAWEICGEAEPEVLLMGFSAGASAIAARAYEHPEVKKIILFAPSTRMPGLKVLEGMRKFKGEAYIIIGDNDDNVGTDSGQIFYDHATGASHRELFVIPDCDHKFRGEKNGRIISVAPFYALASAEKPTFPDPQGGIKLYV